MNKITNALLVLLALLFFSCNRNNGSSEQKETVNPIDPPITLVIDFVNENGESLLSPDTDGNWVGRYITAMPSFLDYPFQWMIGDEYDEYQRQYIHPGLNFTVEKYGGRPYCVFGKFYHPCVIDMGFPAKNTDSQIQIISSYETNGDGTRKRVGHVIYGGKEVTPNFTITISASDIL